MVRGCAELFTNVSFYFLLFELGLSVTGCVMVADLKTKYLDYHVQNVVTLTVGIYALVTALLVIELILEANVEINELLYIMLLLPGGILNIVSGVLCAIQYQEDTDDFRPLVLLVTTFSCGFLMIVDVIVTVKEFFVEDETWIL